MYWLLSTALLLRAEDSIPDTIGVGVLFGFAGAEGVERGLSGLAHLGVEM
jgi:hypothetical protein